MQLLFRMVSLLVTDASSGGSISSSVEECMFGQWLNAYHRKIAPSNDEGTESALLHLAAAHWSSGGGVVCLSHFLHGRPFSQGIE